MTTSITLITSADQMRNDAFRLAHVSDIGMIVTSRNGVGGVSRIDPLDGAPFTGFALTGSDPPNHWYGNNFSVDWQVAGGEGPRHIYVRRNTDLGRPAFGAGTTGTAVEATAHGGANIAEVAVKPLHPYGYYTTGGPIDATLLYRWNRADETSATPTLLVTSDAGAQLDHVVIDNDDVHVWIGGNNGAIHKYTDAGVFVLSLVMPGGDYVGGMCARPGDGLIVLTDASGVGNTTDWFEVDADGNVTNINAHVTVDGTPWLDIPELAESDWGSPYIHLRNYGDRIGWGGNYGYGSLDSRRAYHGMMTVAVPDVGGTWSAMWG